MTKKQKIGYVAASAILLVGIFVLGIYVGYERRPFVERISGVANTTVPTDIAADGDFEHFWKVWKLIDEKYPGAKNVSATERIYGAIQGLVGSLGDPYSVYFPPEEAQGFEEMINGSFEGIGMEVGIKDKVLTVIAPLKNTPAERAGIRAGDMILKINDTTTADMSVDKAVQLIRGKKGTTVTLSIYREGEDKPQDIVVERDTIVIPTLESELRPDGTYVINLYNFGTSSADMMLDALMKFKASGSRNLIIDLRNNPGGFLESAVYMAGFFLPEGEVVVTEDFGENGDPKTYRSRGYDLLNVENTNVVILVDAGSASASEILAGALREHGVATLIGERTYGKGSVQELVKVGEGTSLKLTVAKWLTPNGISISDHGLTPDIEVIPTEKDIEAKRDPAMERAVDYLKNGK